jgi:putative flavoprotein involved in K+ transport
VTNDNERHCLDTVVVGGGQSGLAAGYHLKAAGRAFAILDAHPRVGDAWRNRWDSLRLFTPNRHSYLPGLPPPGPPQAFPGKDAMAAYLQAYAEHFRLPVRPSTAVERVWEERGHYVLATDRGRLIADNVILATGSGSPRLPDFAAHLDPGIQQLHSVHYRRPEQLLDGPTLLVGAANSGAEIAADIAGQPRRGHVILSGRDVGELPNPIPDSIPLPVWHVIWWLVDRALPVDGRGGRRLRAALGGGGMPRVRVTRRALDAAGVERAPRTVGTRAGRPLLADGRVLDVANIVWCTGFARDYSWIDLPILDGNGRPDHDHGVSTRVPGVYYVGLPYQRGFTSGLVGGAGRDAEHVVDHLCATRPPTATV